MKRLRTFCIVLYIILLFVSTVFAEDDSLARLTLGEDKWIAVHGLLQVQGYTQNEYDSLAGENEGDAVWTRDFQVRRSSLIFNGQAVKNVEFFFGTDYDYEIEGEENRGIFIQDAYINYKIANGFEIVVGLFPLPFMHQNMESAASLLGVDYNSLVIPLRSSFDNWRDAGVELRGLLGNIFDYRVGVFRGQERDLQGTEETSDDINSTSAPRFCGRFQMNFLDPENGFFYSGNYLGRKNVFSIGGGVDFQEHATRMDGDIEHYLAWTGDLTVDYKIMTDMVLTVQGAYVYVNNNPGSSVKSQNGYFGQVGFLIDNFQPVIKYEFWDGDTEYGDDMKTAYLTMGLNYFISGHNANIKFEYQNPMGKDNKDVSGGKKATLQCQIFI